MRRRRLLWCSVAALGIATASTGTANAQKLAGPVTRSIVVKTLPRLPGVPVVHEGKRFLTDATGRARVFYKTYAKKGNVSGDILNDLTVPETEITPGTRVEMNRVNASRRVITLNVYYLIGLEYRDLQGDPIPYDQVRETSVKSRTGERVIFKGDEQRWLHGSRVVAFGPRLVNKIIDYQVEEALVDGTSVVRRGQQRFVPKQVGGGNRTSVELLFYSVRFSAHDALFKFGTGAGINLEYPDGEIHRIPFGDQSQVTVAALPRGDYNVTVNAAGKSFKRPVSVSRNQVVELEVLSWLDLAFGGGVLLLIALALLVARRPRLRRLPRRRQRAKTHA